MERYVGNIRPWNIRSCSPLGMTLTTAMGWDVSIFVCHPYMGLALTSSYNQQDMRVISQLASERAIMLSLCFMLYGEMEGCNALEYGCRISISWGQSCLAPTTFYIWAFTEMGDIQSLPSPLHWTSVLGEGSSRILLGLMFHLPLQTGPCCWSVVYQDLSAGIKKSVCVRQGFWNRMTLLTMPESRTTTGGKVLLWGQPLSVPGRSETFGNVEGLQKAGLGHSMHLWVTFCYLCVLVWPL